MGYLYKCELYSHKGNVGQFLCSYSFDPLARESRNSIPSSYLHSHNPQLPTWMIHFGAAASACTSSAGTTLIFDEYRFPSQNIDQDRLVGAHCPIIEQISLFHAAGQDIAKTEVGR